MDGKSEEMLRTLRASGTEFSRKATALAELLKEVESVLIDMDGKVDCFVDLDTSSVCLQLQFHRGSRGWGLFVFENYIDRDGAPQSQTTPLRDASFQNKAKAAKGLPSLIQSILNVHSQHLAEMNEGLESLKSISWLDVDGALAVDGVEDGCFRPDMNKIFQGSVVLDGSPIRTQLEDASNCLTESLSRNTIETMSEFEKIAEYDRALLQEHISDITRPLREDK